jgi:hypothetical protein
MHSPIGDGFFASWEVSTALEETRPRRDGARHLLPRRGLSMREMRCSTCKWDFNRVLNIQKGFSIRSLEFNGDLNNVLEIQQGFQKGPKIQQGFQKGFLKCNQGFQKGP